jgi:hypothetical protein
MKRQDDPENGGGGHGPWFSFASARERLRAVWRDLIRVNASDRRWEMPLAAAL